MKRLYFIYCIVKSQFGDIGIVWKSANKKIKIVRIFLPVPQRDIVRAIRKFFPDVRSGNSCMIENIYNKLEKFLKGKPVDFSLDITDLTQLYTFQKSVLLFERKIPHGRVSTYGRLAMKIGRPCAARAVGQALARNPFPIIIPCHRAIRSDGSLGGFSGGIKLKRKLLELEGIKFNSKGKVIMEKVW